MATIVHDLPPSLKLEGGLFTAGATVIPGGLTSAGIGLQKIVPGGRATLIARYYPVRRDAASIGGWLAKRALEGAVLRLPVAVRQQLIRPVEMGFSRDAERGQPWDNSQPWDNGMNWAFEPSLELSGSVGIGDTTLQLIVGNARYLRAGIVIGYDSRAYMIDRVDYLDNNALITFAPPAREAIPNGSLITLRPMMLGRVQDPQGFAQAIGHNQSYAPAEVTFVEALI